MPRKANKPATGIYSACPGCLLITVNVREITFRDTVRGIYTRTLVDHPSPSLIILDLRNVLFLSRAACDELLSIQDNCPCPSITVNIPPSVQAMIDIVRKTHNNKTK